MTVPEIEAAKLSIRIGKPCPLCRTALASATGAIYCFACGPRGPRLVRSTLA